MGRVSRSVLAGVMLATLACAHVKPLSVHSEVVCLMSFAFISRAMSATASSWMMTALLGTNVPTPIA